MSKKTNITGYHVQVEVDSRYVLGDSVKYAKEICEDLKRDIKRHCDGFSSVDVIAETETVCEHCGYNWGEVSTEYNGGCCEKDQENDPEGENANVA